MNKKTMGILIGITILLTGCGIDSGSQATLASPSGFSGPTERENSSSTMTVGNAVVPSTTPRSTPFPTAISTYSTAVPTFTVEEENEKILNLLQDNGECDLPCIWGVYPDEEHVDINQAFFQQFQNYLDAGRYEARKGGSLIVDNQRMQFEKINSEGMLQVNMILYDHWYAFLSARYHPTGEVGYVSTFGSPTFNKMIQIYGIDSILKKYGRPAKVWVAAWPRSLASKREHEPFNIVLYYPDKGILVQYEGESEKSGNELSLCPWETDLILTTWNTSQTDPMKTSDPFIKELRGVSTYDFGQQEDYFLPLEEATSITVDEFYELFKDPDAKGCIVTPADIWKGY